MHLAWCTDTCHYYDMYQPRRILFDPMMMMSMRIIHEHEKVQKADQRTSITWSKANINQITSTSKWTQDFGGHLEMISIQEFYEFYDAKLHNLWRYKFTNVFNLSKATPCSLGHPQVSVNEAGGQVSSSKMQRSPCTKMPTEFDVSQQKMNLLRAFWMNEASYEVPWPQVLCKNCRLQGWSLSQGCNMQSTDNHWLSVRI